MKKLNVLLFFIPAYFGFSQEYNDEMIIVDTNIYNGDSIVVFNNGDWEYMEDISVKKKPSIGIVNGVVSLSKADIKNGGWSNNRTFTLNYDLGVINDSLKINLKGYVKPVDLNCNSRFKIRHGKWHKGHDYAGKIGTKIKSSWGGVVRYAKFNGGGYGKLVIIRHYNGLETYYAHLSKINVSPNEEVQAGDVIGHLGSTGHSTGPHLHYEIRFLENPIDPYNIQKLNSLNKELIIQKELFLCSNKKQGNKSIYDFVFYEQGKAVIERKRNRRRTSGNLD